MGMLTEQDLGQIGKLILDSEGRLEKKIEESSVKTADRVIAAVGEMLEQNVLPQIEEVRDDIVGIKATMVTKDYLDEKLGGLKGDMTAKHKEFDRRLTALELRPKTPLG
ncbi:MAG: hypothetical protein AAB554_01995 [Patescibacteria group bacterium]